jgi:hypothetical protein
MESARPPGSDQEPLFTALLMMPDFLAQTFADLPASDSCVPGPGGSFSPVEHCWHLADLERDGYAVRIHRLLSETAPDLPDFDGARVAAERQYQRLELADGLAAFREARLANVLRLRAAATDDWSRSGTQAGVGPVSLADVPRMMAEHDAGHRQEIDAWLQAHKKDKGPR